MFFVVVVVYVIKITKKKCDDTTINKFDALKRR